MSVGTAEVVHENSLARLPVSDERRVTILGATGSIGSSTLDLIRQSGGRYRVEAVTAHTNVEKLSMIARQVGASLAVVAEPSLYRDLQDKLSGTNIDVAAGYDAMVEAAARPADVVVGGIVGSAGLAPCLAALQSGSALALANKECIVCAGDLFMNRAAQAGAKILPIDSEHNAIFQVLDGAGRKGVEKIILTASGGPFRTASLERMRLARRDDALSHPTWEMGAKISVDSATMMNKGLEIIEAHYLFDMPEPQIEVLVHPQSIIHSLVAYADGSVMAQLGCPDMRIPIAHALAYPDRRSTENPRLDLASVGQLSFEAPDPTRFPSLSLARAALREQNGAPAVLNAANEVAVAAFLEERIGFMDIPVIVESTLSKVDRVELNDLDSVLSLDAEARHVARTQVENSRFDA